MSHQSRPNYTQTNMAAALRFSHFAMATEFEIYTAQAEPAYAEQACQAAFAELDRLENDLSRFLPGSDVSRINQLQPGERIIVGPDCLDCLKTCFHYYLATEGAFDISVGALYRCWLNSDKTLRNPAPDEIHAAGALTGLHHLFIDETTFAVSKDLAGVQIDLGAFAKGYAVDRMAEILRDWDMDAALIHGGTSSVYAYGPEPGWPVTISHPLDHSRILRHLNLHNAAMGGSGLQKGNHIIDPRQGRPVHHFLASWVIADDAASADALSTAFMVMSDHEVQRFCAAHPEIKAAILPAAPTEAELLLFF